jgi:hypothetical protein
MLQPGREYSVSGYRYGFQTQEKSLELNENSYTAEFWEYDARIGRRWNTDPKPDVSFSPYNCFNGNPIWFSDIQGDTLINGQKFEAMSGGAATLLPNVTIMSSRKGAQPSSQKSGGSTPLSELNSIILDRTTTNLHKLQKLQSGEFNYELFTSSGWERRINTDYSEDIRTGNTANGAVFRSELAKSVTETLEKGFALLDIYNISLSQKGGNLEIPLIGSATQPFVNNLVSETDRWLFETSIQRGYLYVARFLQSNPGGRTNIMGVYATDDVMKQIIKDGGLIMTRHNILDTYGAYPDQSPYGPNMEKDYYKYFIFFNKEKRKEAIIKSFGVLPVTGQKWGE